MQKWLAKCSGERSWSQNVSDSRKTSVVVKTANWLLSSISKKNRKKIKLLWSCINPLWTTMSWILHSVLIFPSPKRYRRTVKGLQGRQEEWNCFPVSLGRLGLFVCKNHVRREIRQKTEKPWMISECEQGILSHCFSERELQGSHSSYSEWDFWI